MLRHVCWKHLFFPSLGTVGILLSGCAGTFGSGDVLSETDPYFLLQQVRKHASHLETFQGEAVWTAASEEGAMRGTARLAFKTPDSLWMKVEGPWGIDLAYASVTGDTVSVFSPMLNRSFRGDAKDATAGSLLPFSPALPKHLLGAVGLMVPNDSLLETLTSFYPEKNEYLLDFQTGDHLRIQKKGPVVSRWEKRDSTGAVVWSWDGERFRNKGGMRIPQLIHLNTDKRQRLIVYYETVKINSVLRKGWCDVPILEGIETVKP